MRGSPVATGELDAVREGLNHNTTVEEVDLSDGDLELRPAIGFRNIFATNKTITSFQLPDDHSNFAVITADDRVYGFRTIGNVDRPDLDFALHTTDLDDLPLSKDELEAAQMAFAPFQTDARTLYSAIYDPVADNRKAAIHREFDASVMHFMAAASRQSAGIFDGMNKFIVDYLEAQNALPGLVSLTAVNKATVSGRPRPYARSLALERQVLSEAHQLGPLPRDLNVLRGKNDQNLREETNMVLYELAISDSASDHRFEQLRLALARGAIDVNGIVEAATESASAIEALRLARVVTTTTTTTTSTNAITTTTGAALAKDADGAMASDGNTSASLGNASAAEPRPEDAE